MPIDDIVDTIYYNFPNAFVENISNKLIAILPWALKYC